MDPVMKALLFSLLLCCTAMAQAPIRLIVDAGDRARTDALVSVEIPDLRLPSPLHLVEVTAGQRIALPAQVEQSAPPRLHFVLAGQTPANTRRSFEIVAGPLVVEWGVQAVKAERTLDIRVGQRPVLSYHHAIMEPPAGQNPLFRRSGFIHPLNSPAGVVLTTIHPADHIHHMGIWNAWTMTEFEGRKVDFWNLREGQGTVRFTRFESTTSGPVFGGFRAHLEHVNLNAPGGEKVALNELLDVRVWNVGGPDKGGWLVDWTSTQTCATDSPLVLPQYRYGGFAFRGTEHWKGDASELLTSEGRTRRDSHATRSRWCLIQGATAAAPAGIILMSHPENREHPEPMRTWPEASNHQFFNYCPIQQKAWKLEPGNNYTFRYRLYAFDGRTAADQAERIWHDFGNPPKVTVQK
jgi:hypothetical protein